jgi:hypothetical protein
VTQVGAGSTPVRHPIERPLLRGRSFYVDNRLLGWYPTDMNPIFDGHDENRYIQEAAELRVKHGMSWDALPFAFYLDEEWQLWWRDVRNSMWWRYTAEGVVQQPLDVVP